VDRTFAFVLPGSRITFDSRVWRRFFFDQKIMTNDTVVFDAMRFDIRIGQYVWTRRVGTPEAIRRDGLFIAGLPQYCPHEWLDEKGYVDSDLACKHPYPPTKSARS
jgi:hypothetical protein